MPISDQIMYKMGSTMIAIKCATTRMATTMHTESHAGLVQSGSPHVLSSAFNLPLHFVQHCAEWKQKSAASFSSFYRFIWVFRLRPKCNKMYFPIDKFGPRDPFTFWLQFGKCQNKSWSRNDFQALCPSGPHNLHEVRADDKRLKPMVCT